MTDEMLALARQNAADAGVTNAIFLKGVIEQIPLPADSVDVVISNCVINLSIDKPAVLTRDRRACSGRAGGSGSATSSPRIAFAGGARASAAATSAASRARCRRREYVAGLEAAGFEDVSRRVHARGRRRHARRDRQGRQDPRASRPRPTPSPHQPAPAPAAAEIDQGGEPCPRSLDPVTRQPRRPGSRSARGVSSQDVFSQETIARYIAESTDLLGGEAKINVFVPVLVHRFARERLKALAPGGGRDRRRSSPRCCSSASTTRAAARWPPGSSSCAPRGASTSARPAARPARRSTPPSSRRWRELGVDMSEEFPKPLTDEVVRAADVVITMGCGDACPIYPGKRYEDWELDDPAGQDLETVRRIRDEIDARVQRLIAELLPR